MYNLCSCCNEKNFERKGHRKEFGRSVGVNLVSSAVDSCCMAMKMSFLLFDRAHCVFRRQWYTALRALSSGGGSMRSVVRPARTASNLLRTCNFWATCNCKLITAKDWKWPLKKWYTSRVCIATCPFVEIWCDSLGLWQA